ncbi:MAG: hypothetical protein ACK5WE_20480, partial [bacterium]
MKRVRMRRRGMLALASGLGGAGLGLGAMPLLAQSPAATKPLDRNGGPYVPTPWPGVDQMIRAASSGARDLVRDRGCGEGGVGR